MPRFNELLTIINDDLALQREQIESLKKIMDLLNKNPSLSQEHENQKQNLMQRIRLSIESYEKHKKVIENIKSESDLARYKDEVAALAREDEKMLMNNLENLNKTLDTWIEKEKSSIELNKQSNKTKH